MKDRYYVTLRRTDFNKSEVISPFSISNIKRKLEDEGIGHRKAIAPTMSLTFYTEDIIDFLTPYPTDASVMRCDVKHYEVFDDQHKTLVFAGVAEQLPIEKVVFNNETISLNFSSIVLTWESGVDIKDNDEYYKYISVTDALRLFDTEFEVIRGSQ